MGTDILNWHFPSPQRFVDFVRVHSKYYELCLRTYLVEEYVRAQNTGRNDVMQYWRDMLEMSSDQLLDPRHQIHDELECRIGRIEPANSWIEKISIIEDFARRAADLYRRYELSVKTLMVHGINHFKANLDEEREIRFRQSLTDAAEYVTGIAEKISRIKDEDLKATVIASMAKLTVELDDSFRRSKSRLTSTDKRLSLPPSPPDQES